MGADMGYGVGPVGHEQCCLPHALSTGGPGGLKWEGGMRAFSLSLFFLVLLRWAWRRTVNPALSDALPLQRLFFSCLDFLGSRVLLIFLGWGRGPWMCVGGCARHTW